MRIALAALFIIAVAAGPVMAQQSARDMLGGSADLRWLEDREPAGGDHPDLLIGKAQSIGAADEWSYLATVENHGDVAYCIRPDLRVSDPNGTIAFIQTERFTVPPHQSVRILQGAGLYTRDHPGWDVVFGGRAREGEC